MASVGVDMAREILLRVSTRDLARCSCVCKLWRAVVRDPAFGALHAHVVSCPGGEAETLLVTEFHGQGMGSEMTVLSATSGMKPIRRFTELAAGYSPANACNGFLLLAPAKLDWPVFVCNPVTGEKLKIPAPPENEHVERCTYAMGFSESARLYKLFRLSFPGYSWPRTHECYVDVYTLGARDGGWRRHPDLFCAEYDLRPPPPVLADGKLYVVIERPENFRAPDMILSIDVASEAHHRYWLPEMFTEPVKAAVHAFELSGKLCVAIRIVGRRRVNFWVLMSPYGRRMELDWERRYTFYLDDDGEYGDKPCCAWLDRGDGMLCYRFGDRLYKWNATKKRQQKQRIELPPTPDKQWNVYGGYRPSQLSPQIAFASGSLRQQHREKQEQFEYTLRHALARQESSKKRSCSTCLPDDHHGAKRIRGPTKY
ncbi:unnamed protein product [Alopecurus aequalis]